MNQECYYCEQIFETKEKLSEHLEVHSDIEKNREITQRRKEGKFGKTE